jgi:hypothetical protein
MGYSVSVQTHCCGEDTRADSASLLGFAYNRATQYGSDIIGGSIEELCIDPTPEGILTILQLPFLPITIPAVFVGSIFSGPILYKCPNSYIEGTPEYQERVSKIRIEKDSKGLVRIIYPSE